MELERTTLLPQERKQLAHNSLPPMVGMGDDIANEADVEGLTCAGALQCALPEIGVGNDSRWIVCRAHANAEVSVARRKNDGVFLSNGVFHRRLPQVLL